MNRIALTYDDGPSEWTPAILDLLAEHEAQATFFVCGHAVVPHAPAFFRIAKEGHQLGNHTWNHRRLSDLTVEEAIAEELVPTSTLIGNMLGASAKPKVWRVPYFDSPPAVQACMGLMGLVHVGATVIPDDWAKDDPEEIARLVLSEAVDGSVVCLHDGIPPGGGNGTASRAATVEATRLILEGLAGWEFVSVGELL